MIGLKLFGVAVAAVVVQTSLFTTVRFDGVAFEFPILLPALAGFGACQQAVSVLDGSLEHGDRIHHVDPQSPDLVPRRRPHVDVRIVHRKRVCGERASTH